MTGDVEAWRIGATTRDYAADDMSGNGAAKAPGRWNDKGQHVVYAGPTIAMSVLETAAHINTNGFPLDRYLVRITIPAALWAARTIVQVKKLPVGWDAIPESIIAVEFGSKWYKSSKSLLLELPSVIVPEETILVINATHPDAAKLKAKAIRRFEYDVLFRHK